MKQECLKKIKIGNIELQNNVVLAPMAGITDLPFRLLAKQGGAALVYTEMVSAKALIYDDDKTKKLLTIDEKERPVSVQIFGSDSQSLSEAAKRAQNLGADIIDINLGCPVKKIAKSGAGAKLLANKELIEDILTKTAQSINIPLTIKIRLGIAAGQNLAVEIIETAQNCGVQMIALHARYACQGHSGAVDLKAFADCCKAAKIPIIANGAIIDAKSAESFLNIEGCRGLMIGRGAIANFEIFKSLQDFFDKGEPIKQVSLSDKLLWFQTYFKSAHDYYGEKKALVLMRKTAPYYITGFKNAAVIRASFNKIETSKEFDALMNSI
ncbi:MAG: tRNA dihydrouridine synthase DusB [Elusimicrobiota bacterium]|jgi:tRNA-dihydrouridine synthase B|nr:tRNA dihydrouridine synthase DusB [Elusimicrobiota bacterium]